MELSTKATRNVREGLDLEASLEITTPQAVVGLAEFFAPVIKPEESFDLSALFVLKNRKLRWCREQVVARDLEHRKQVEELTRLLKKRDELTSTLGSKLVTLRRVCLGLYDDEELVRLGLDGAVSQDPVTVYRQGQKAWGRFRDSDLEPPSSEWLDVTIATDKLIDGLGDFQALGRTLTEVSQQRRRVQTAAAARRKAAEDFDRHYQLIGSSVEADYRMAGFVAEADRARTPRRRASRVAEDEEPATDTSPTGDESQAGDTPEADDTPEATDPTQDPPAIP